MSCRNVAVLTVALALAAAGALASAAPARPSKPGRVVVSADVVYVNACGFPSSNSNGHVEVAAYDDDQTPVVGSADRQDDRMEITVTWDDGTPWPQDPLGVEMRDPDTAFLASTSWAMGWTLHDGGNPGSATTGELDQGVPVTRDWLQYQGPTMCSSGRFYLTSGQVRITPGA